MHGILAAIRIGLKDMRGDLRRFQSNDLAPDYWRLYGGITFILGK